MKKPAVLPERLVATNDIVQSEDVHRNTLRRWWNLGLLPEPRRYRYGQGFHYVWPANVVDRIRTIKRLQAEGWSLKTVRQYLAANLANREYVERKAEELMAEWTIVDPLHRVDGSPLDRYVAMVVATLGDLPITPTFRDRIRDAARARFLDTLRILIGGFEPVLVSDGSHTEVIPKPILGVIVAGRAISASGPAIHAGPLFVLELIPILSSAWGRLDGPYLCPRFRSPFVVREEVEPIFDGGVHIGDTCLEYDFAVDVGSDGVTTIRVNEASAHPATEVNHSLRELVDDANEPTWRGKRMKEGKPKTSPRRTKARRRQ
jgi:DNA-binding transcriptional MerR regulator